MKGLKASTLGVLAVALAILAPVALAGPSTETTSYTVAAGTVPGVATGFVLEPGRSVTITATGTVCAGLACVGPNGEPSWNTTVSSFGGFVAPGAPAWGLVGRVGSGPWTQIGSGPTTLTGSGELQFAVNDDLFVDNSGSFT
ncbi:MAG TPA: hypothetical protein VFN99_08505, partial [Gaiella sp.]|nr:hypothetical protein [Gaiella sp.]